MKALIVSDSHGLTQELEMLKERHQDVTVYIHCGDSELSLEDEALNMYKVVRGNCDADSRLPNYISEKLLGVKFFITHGHHYNVKMTLMNLAYKAEEEDAKVICFGHSHIAGSEMIEGKLFINPGSILLPKDVKEKTYVILEVIDHEVKVQFYNLEGKFLESISNTYHIE